MLAEDRNIPEEEAFGEIMKTFQYIQQENMGMAAAQAPLMPPPAPEGEEGGQNPPPEEQGGESDG